MVSVLELDVLFDVELLDRGGTHSIPRMAHCTSDLNCTYSRVLSFHGVVLKFLRGFFFHERRHLVGIHLQIV